MIEQSERERQASDYEALAEMFEQCGETVFAEHWRKRADELLAEEMAEMIVPEGAA